MSNNKHLEEKLNELEMKLCFQDDLIESLNKTVTRQDKEIRELWTANRLLKQGLNDIKDNGEAVSNEPPPHY